MAEGNPLNLFTSTASSTPIVFALDRSSKFEDVVAMIEAGGGIVQTYKTRDTSGHRINLMDHDDPKASQLCRKLVVSRKSSKGSTLSFWRLWATLGISYKHIAGL